MSTVTEGARLYRERNGIVGQAPAPAQVAPTRSPVAALIGDRDRDDLVSRFQLDEQEAQLLSGSPEQMDSQAKRLNDLRGVHRIPEFTAGPRPGVGSGPVPTDTSSVASGSDLYKQRKESGFPGLSVVE